MKRWSVVSVLLVALGLAAFAPQPTYGQGGDYDTGTAQGGGMTQGGGMMQGGGGMGEGMMRHMHGFMHGPGGGPCIGCIVACASMITPHVVATSDGGVVVAIGGRLIKYNATLRKVADVPIEIDWAQVQRRVEQMVQNCPMNRRMMMPPQRRPYREPPQGQFQGQPGQFQGQPQGEFQGQ